MCIANTPSVTIATTTQTQGKPPYRAFPSSCRATTSRRRRRLVRARQHRKPLRRHDGQVAPNAIPGVRRARLITSTPDVTQNGGKAKPQPPFWVTSRRHITMCSPLETTICAASGSSHMLNSAHTVAFPPTVVPPMRTMRSIRSARPECVHGNSVMFVKGPVETSVILVSSGNPEIERAISTIAGSSDSLRSVAPSSTASPNPDTPCALLSVRV